MDNTVWKLQKETRELLKDIDMQMERIEKELTNGALLVKQKSDALLLREYSYSIGILEGLKRCRNKITVEVENE